MRYAVTVAVDRAVETAESGPHAVRITARGGDAVTLLVAFLDAPSAELFPGAEAARADVAASWAAYWNDGGVVDFSGSADPRARELERRVVLSQYLLSLIHI